MSIRSDIAAAASGIDGVTVTEHYRQTLRAGHGFVKWSGRTRDDSGLGWIDNWQVWICIPKDREGAEKWLTQHLDTLVAAVDTELVVTAAINVDLGLDSKSTNGLIIEGTRPAA